MSSSSSPEAGESPIFQTQKIEPETSFADLPFEVREKIYGYALSTDRWVAPEVGGFRRWRRDRKDDMNGPTDCCGHAPRTAIFPNTRLLRVCRLIEYEASPVFYQNSFCFGDPCCEHCRNRHCRFHNFTSLIPFLSNLQEKNRRLLKHLVLGFSYKFGLYGTTYESIANAAIRLFTGSLTLQSLDLRTHDKCEAAVLFQEPESEFLSRLANLRGFEQLTVSPWPKTLEEYEKHLSERQANQYTVRDPVVAYRRYLDLKATMMQPREQVHVALSGSEKRALETGDESQGSMSHATKRAKSSHVI